MMDENNDAVTDGQGFSVAGQRNIVWFLDTEHFNLYDAESLSTVPDARPISLVVQSLAQRHTCFALF